MTDARKAHLGFELTDRKAWKGEEAWATVDVSFWSYHGERAQLTIVEGNHTEQENRDIVSEAYRKRKGEESGNCSNCPQLISFNCRASALVDLARTILRTYDPNCKLKE
jgi:hypothetical protein